MAPQQLSKSRRIFIRREKTRIRKSVLDKAEQEKQIAAIYEKLGVSITILKPKEVIKDITYETFGCIAAISTSSVVTDTIDSDRDYDHS